MIISCHFQGPLADRCTNIAVGFGLLKLRTSFRLLVPVRQKVVWGTPSGILSNQVPIAHVVKFYVSQLRLNLLFHPTIRFFLDCLLTFAIELRLH